MAAQAQRLDVSLLTCFPGQEVFELYGHTAIRITDGATMDRVYNFGLFSFNQPHFIYRFVKGETDLCRRRIPHGIFHTRICRQRL